MIIAVVKLSFDLSFLLVLPLVEMVFLFLSVTAECYSLRDNLSFKARLKTSIFCCVSQIGGVTVITVIVCSI